MSSVKSQSIRVFVLVADHLSFASDLVLESQERNAATERYKGEVTRVETLLAQRDLALNQAQKDLTEAQG